VPKCSRSHHPCERSPGRSWWLWRFLLGAVGLSMSQQVAGWFSVTVLDGKRGTWRLGQIPVSGTEEWVTETGHLGRISLPKLPLSDNEKPRLQ